MEPAQWAGDHRLAVDWARAADERGRATRVPARDAVSASAAECGEDSPDADLDAASDAASDG